MSEPNSERTLDLRGVYIEKIIRLFPVEVVDVTARFRKRTLYDGIMPAGVGSPRYDNIPVGWARQWRNPSIDALDEKSARLTKVDVSAIQLIKMRDETDWRIERCVWRGKMYLIFEKSGFTYLDARVSLALMANKKIIPENWRREGKIYFGGTIILDSDGRPHICYIEWDDVQSDWVWHIKYFSQTWHPGDKSAVLFR